MTQRFWWPHSNEAIYDDNTTASQKVALLRENYDALEQYLSNLSATGGVVFDFPGPLLIAVSDKFTAPAGTSVSAWNAALVVSGSTSTTFNILKNGVSIASESIGSGSTLASFTLSVSLTATDTLQIQITGVGTGASGLTVSAQ